MPALEFNNSLSFDLSLFCNEEILLLIVNNSLEALSLILPSLEIAKVIVAFNEG